MTKKDFELIASVLKDCKQVIPQYEQYSYDMITSKLSDKLAQVNPRFNRDRFLKACGVENSIRVVSDSEHSKEYLDGEKLSFDL